MLHGSPSNMTINPNRKSLIEKVAIDPHTLAINRCSKKAHMIHRTVSTWQGSRWQGEITKLICSPAELIKLLELEPALLTPDMEAEETILLRVPRTYASREINGEH